jgi:hypothetical protein
MLLRCGGAALLVAAWRIALWLGWLGRGQAGHEPASVYALCLLAFLCASAGAALLANGLNLFGKARTGALWTPYREADSTETAPRRDHRA